MFTGGSAIRLTSRVIPPKRGVDGGRGYGIGCGLRLYAHGYGVGGSEGDMFRYVSLKGGEAAHVGSGRMAVDYEFGAAVHAGAPQFHAPSAPRWRNLEAPHIAGLVAWFHFHSLHHPFAGNLERVPILGVLKAREGGVGGRGHPPGAVERQPRPPHIVGHGR